MSKILGMDLTNKDDCIVAVSGNVYVKTPEALVTLLDELRSIGFEIDNLRESKNRKENGTSVETMEKSGWSLWFAKLDTCRGKCNSCNGIISTAGIRVHGHKCELCGNVTYCEIVNGSTVRFSFIQHDEEEYDGMADLTLRAKHWDTDEGYLYCYPEVMNGLWLRGDRAQKYLDDNKDKWEEVTESDQKLIRLKYPNPWDHNVSAIEPSDINGHYWNHEIVKIWQGKEYPEYSGDYPLPDTINIYEAWHWPKHPKSPTLHRTILHACGQTDDKGWHYQDGTPWFRPAHWQNMSSFIRHFTVLDADVFDNAWPNFRSDGPGGIDDLAAFCCEDAEVTNNPNIGNLLHGFGRIMNDSNLTEDEVTAIEHAAADRSIMRDFGVITGDRS